MPHQCTDCARTFADGSKEMLSGCPDCGGTTFQYRPAGETAEEPPEASPPERETPGEGTVARTVGTAATAVRDLVGSSAPDPPAPDPSPTADDSAGESTAESGAANASASSPAGEDAAQASARTDVVSPSELPAAPDTLPADRPAPVDEDESAVDPDPGDDASRDRPGLADLRAELNEQFESIKVVEPGQYELNLMELYDREEYIIALQEDGRYTIQVPERWDED